MKSFLFSFLLLLFTSNLLAQENIQTGTFNVSGSLSYSSTSSEGNDFSTKQLILTPQVGYFVLDNISLSLAIQYINYSYGEYDDTQWGFGPSVRYYLPLEKVYPFLEMSYLYSKFIDNEDEARKQNTFMISGGLDYFLNESVAIESSISYTFENYKLPESYSAYYSDLEFTRNTLRIGIGLNVFIK